MKARWLIGLFGFALGCTEDPLEEPALTVAAVMRGQTVNLEIAADPDSRARGLMFRRRLGADEGMLFVFPKDEPRSFWMRNTYIPLTIAYLSADRRIVSMADMEPFDESSCLSRFAARYAIETNRGWFVQHGVGVGDVVSFEIPTGMLIR